MRNVYRNFAIESIIAENDCKNHKISIRNSSKGLMNTDTIFYLPLCSKINQPVTKCCIIEDPQ